MKNLTIHKLAFGVLMAFVLAFGVQGIVEAVAPPDSGTEYGSVKMPETNADRQLTTADPTITLSLTGQRPNSLENISINASGGGIDLKMGTNYLRSSVTLTEVENDDNTATAEYSYVDLYGTKRTAGTTLTVEFTSKGKKTITISGTNYTEVTPATDPVTYTSNSWSYIYVYYVSEPASIKTTAVSLVGSGTGYQTGLRGTPRIKIHTRDGNHYRVAYTTTGGTFTIVGTDFTSPAAAAPVTTSSAFDVYLDLPTGTTATVTAQVSGATVTTQTAYIYRLPTLTATTHTDVATKEAETAAGTLVGNSTAAAITATVNDGTGTTGVGGILVRFTVLDSSHAGGTLLFSDSSNLNAAVFGPATTGTLVGSNNRVQLDADGNLITSNQERKTLYVRTAANGVATVNFRLGTAGEQKVTVTAVGKTETVSLFTAAGAGSGLELIRDDIRPRDEKYDVYVRVEEDGEPVGAGYTVEFSTTSPGTLETVPPPDTPAPATVKMQTTDGQSIAHILYDPMGTSGNLRVTATIKEHTAAGTPPEATAAIADQLVLNVRGTSVRDPQTDPDPPPTQNQDIQISVPSTTVSIGQQVSVSASLRTNGVRDTTLSDIPVTFSASSGSFLPATVNTVSGTASSTITIPSGITTITFTVSASGYTDQQSVTVSGTAPEDTTEDTIGEAAALVVTGSADRSGEVNNRLADDLTVRVVDVNDNGVSFELVRFRIVEGRGRLAPSRDTTDSAGYASVSFTPFSSGTIEVEATSGDLDPVIFTITTGEPPDAIRKVSGDNQSGRPGQALANPFVVEVVDENDDPVEGAAVTFAVTAGGGSVSTTSTTTNNNGRAQTVLTLGDEVGDNTVVARVSGLTDRVTFKAASGTEVLVSAAQRPPMYWISRTEGKLHRLVGEEVENLAPNIDNILSLTVDTQNQLLYWTRQTAQSKSAIQRAGLNGRGVITLQTSLTLMTSIAVDSTGTTLYWADILGKIKSRPVQGNRVTLLAQNLSAPTGLVWANEYLYWGEATGQIRRMNLRNNRRTIETITTSSGEPVSLAVQSGRVYWTEISGNASQLNRVNTNGTGVEALKTLVGSRRVWVDVDGSDNKIYLTRASKLERRGLSGRATVTLVTGLASPGSLVLGGELPAGPPVVSQPTQPTQPTDNSKYDVNGDGTVDLLDVIAPLVQPNNMKNDVNGDGVVDIRDTQEIDANRDATAAAPSLDIDVKALDLDFDRVQEQIETLLTSGDRSIAAQRALLYLQHLLASARPDETVLLANYPNPFNPETWIPYHLAESTDVRVNIYDAQGVLVRVLPLGHQTAGYYTSRSRAAYWDGLNALGERVASGIYFYQLQTDETSPMRKMVILK